MLQFSSFQSSVGEAFQGLLSSCPLSLVLEIRLSSFGIQFLSQQDQPEIHRQDINSP